MLTTRAGLRSTITFVTVSTTACSAPPPPPPPRPRLPASSSASASSASPSAPASSASAPSAAAAASEQHGKPVGRCERRVLRALGDGGCLQRRQRLHELRRRLRRGLLRRHGRRHGDARRTALRGRVPGDPGRRDEDADLPRRPGERVRLVHSGSPNLTYDGLNLDAGGGTPTGAVFENGGGDEQHLPQRLDRQRRRPEGGARRRRATSPSTTCASTTPSCSTDGVHMECLYAIVVPDMTIRNSSFSNCAVMDILFTYGDWWSPLPRPTGT